MSPAENRQWHAFLAAIFTIWSLICGMGALASVIKGDYWGQIYMPVVAFVLALFAARNVGRLFKETP